MNWLCRIHAFWLSFCLFAMVSGSSVRASESSAEILDRLVATAWSRAKVQPARLSEDEEFVRRVFLDLVGRIPTGEESERFCSDPDPQKRARLIDSLLARGEFARHWRENLNALFMGGPAFAGNAEWRAWLEEALRGNKPWDEMAREILRGRPDKSGAAGASPFLLSRLAQGDSGLDSVTRDVSRILFGVDIQCSRCHKHPEVKQWKQEYYWGMTAYFNRSYPLQVKGKMFVAERATGDVHYVGKGKEQLMAVPMFLTGEKLPEPTAKPRRAPAAPTKNSPTAAAPTANGKAAAPMEDPADYAVPPEASKEKTRVPVPKFSRREKFIEVAINGKEPFFKRAAVNYVWAQLFGRGLVEPIDQMHDANAPSQPEVLRFLADDFVAHRFDLRHLLRTITNSRVYQLSSRYPGGARQPAEEMFACSLIRPLTAQQLAPALLVATGYYKALKAGTAPASSGNAGALRAKLETEHAVLLADLAKELGGGEPYQPGIREALFETNSESFANLLAKGGLATRLASVHDDTALVTEAFRCVLSRLPTEEEARRLTSYLHTRANRRAAACEQIVWALVTSVEFRFNH